MRICHGVCIAIFSILSVSQAAEQWVYLKDGRLCYASKNSAPFTGIQPDGIEITYTQADIKGTRTPAQVSQAVDAMLIEMAQGKHIEEHTGRLKVLRAAAVPSLLQHLEGDSSAMQFCALYALQFCWSRDAFEPVLKKVKDPDQKLSKTAISALENNVSQTELAKRLKEFADDADVSRAASVFRVVEPVFPDLSLKRSSRLMALPEGRSAVAPLLSRYLCSSFTPMTLELLTSSNIEEVRNATIGLIVENANGTEVRNRMTPYLTNRDADERQLAAEFFARTGDETNLKALKDAFSIESDAYVKAALKAALNAVSLRATVNKMLPVGRSTRWTELKDSASVREKLSLCLEILSNRPSKGDYEAASVLCRSIDQYEKYYRYGAPEEEMALQHDSLELSHIRISVERLLQVAPCGPLEEENDAPERASESIEPSAHFIAPISEYFDTNRKSFGFLMPKEGVFSNSVHIGDDCGRLKELRTVVSIGNGIVRRIGFVRSWGHIIIIEHKMPDGKQVCSLYAHLSSFIYVKPGDYVEMGHKIGTMGRDMSLENGGYRTHLHFGIFDGGFAPAGWICGYISPDKFKAGLHHWLDPQTFLLANK